VWETDELPEAITEVKPIYPELAREAGIDGRVIVEVTIGPNGRIEDAHVVKSIPVLDAAALEAARRWVFTAPLAHGHPVRVRYTIPFVFELH
jgi:protein TonB